MFHRFAYASIYIHTGILLICLERNLTIKCKEKIVDRIIFNNLLVTLRDIIPSPDYKSIYIPVRKRALRK